jgi:hypothetical protein
MVLGQQVVDSLPMHVPQAAHNYLHSPSSFNALSRTDSHLFCSALCLARATTDNRVLLPTDDGTTLSSAAWLPTVSAWKLEAGLC